MEACLSYITSAEPLSRCDHFFLIPSSLNFFHNEHAFDCDAEWDRNACSFPLFSFSPPDIATCPRIASAWQHCTTFLILEVAVVVENPRAHYMCIICPVNDLLF